MIGLREPPYNAHAEQALLGALMANNKALDRVAEFLRPEHFADALHGRIYGAILDRVMANKVADTVTLRDVFEHDPEMAEAPGGVGYLATLLGAMVGIINAGSYGKTIRETWMRRALIEACEVATNDAFNPGDQTIAQVLEAHDAALLRIAEGAGDETPAVQFGAAVAEQLAATQAAANRASPLAGISTGYAALDRMTLGLQAGKLILLAARPSMGKTALGLGIAVRAAMTGARVLFWSGEMGAAQLGARAAAAYTGLPTTSVFSARRWPLPNDADRSLKPLTMEDWTRLSGAERAARTLPLHFDARPGMTVQGLRARARRMRRGAGLDLLVIDYVGLLRSTNPRHSLYERITEVSGDLMALKAELNIPVLALVQLNRANESREDKTPQLSDLRDSGALEQDADVVMMLHRPHYYLSRSEPQRRPGDTDDAYHNRVAAHREQTAHEAGRATFAVPKNRQGPTGLTRLLFEDETTWFRDESEGRDGPAWGGRIGI